MTTSSAYLGNKASERWKVYQDGKPLVEYRPLDKDHVKTIEICKFDRCMCFDYLQLKEKFDMNLEYVKGEDADAREKAEQDEEDRERDERRNPRLF